MAEPNTSGAGLGALAIAVAGPAIGPYALITGCALAGAMWPLQNMELNTAEQRKNGAFFLVRVVTLALVVTSAITWFLTEKTGLPLHDGMALVSLIIGAVGDGWGMVFKALRDRFTGTARGGLNSGDKPDGNP